MQLKNISVIKDNRSECYSIMGITNISDYISFVKEVYDKRGGISGQRDVLKSSTAIKIRKRMVKDISNGTVLPPIVIGLLVPEGKYEEISEKIDADNSLDSNFVSEIMSSVLPENISLIDGMQRTTAIIDALAMNNSINNNIIRVEFWVVKELNNLIYRMLILNTGQVPWNVRRQLEVLFSPIKKTIQERIPNVVIYSIDDERRRSASSQFQGNDIIELFLAFGSRKEKVELKERIAEEFTRLDFIETSDKNNLMEYFIRSFSMLNELDNELEKIKEELDFDGKKPRFYNGYDLFSSQPARIGFIVALAIKILGRPGTNKEICLQEQSLDDIESNFKGLINKIRNIDKGIDFLSFHTLNEILDKPSSKVGDFERLFFKEAFTSLIDQKFNVDNFESCWRAY
jgi:hypothetical protein